jgi:hypothetical protein
VRTRPLLSETDNYPTFQALPLLRAVILLVLAGAILVTKADPDLWGHVRFGQDILSAKRLTSVDPYSFTQDRPWVNHEWLSEVAMASAYALGSLGLVGLKLLVVGAVFVVIGRSLPAVPPLLREAALVLVAWAALPLTMTVRVVVRADDAARELCFP